MSLVTRVSVAFLVALALALGGFSACLYFYCNSFSAAFSRMQGGNR
jgi:hypothetical protein